MNPILSSKLWVAFPMDISDRRRSSNSFDVFKLNRLTRRIREKVQKIWMADSAAVWSVLTSLNPKNPRAKDTAQVRATAFSRHSYF